MTDLDLAGFGRTLRAWQPAAREQSERRAAYLGFLKQRGASAADRDCGPEHLTASCFVFNPELTHTLLCFHKKAQFWVQVGGHIEPGDASVAAAGLREAREESGLAALDLLDQAPYDLEWHLLTGSFGRCTAHWDVGFAAVAERDATLAVSAESEALAWWPLAELPPQSPTGFADRVHGVLAELRARRRVD